MKPSILVVDDSKAMRFMLQTIFAKKFKVITASDTAAAMYYLSKRNFPDVIITDNVLSDSKDWEFVSNLKNSFFYKDIPVIVLSTLSEAVTEKNCSFFKVDKYFLKPFNPIYLIDTVDTLLQQKQMVN
jgi:PleD family two-component response regulator